MKDPNQLLTGIDYYIHLHEENRKNLLSFNTSTLGAKKHGLDYGAIREKAFGKIPEVKEGVQLDEFIEDLADWRRAKTFYSLERAEEVIQNFKKLQFEIPKYLGTCYNEVKERTEFIETVTSEGLKWGDYSKQEFIRELQRELVEYSLDEESKKIRIRELFYNRVEKLKSFNRTVLEKFGFFIDMLFEEDEFTGDSYNLNLYFFEGEKKQQTSETFGILRRTLIDYYQLKKEILFIQDLVRSEASEIPLTEGEPVKRKSEELKENLFNYGFSKLPLVDQLTGEGKTKLIDLIGSKDLPYTIAMFDYLGFLSFLEKEHFQTKYKLNRKLSEWLNSDKEGRAVKGNISSLLPNTTENKSRYTAFKHKETVKKDYQKLK